MAQGTEQLGLFRSTCRGVDSPDRQLCQAWKRWTTQDSGDKSKQLNNNYITLYTTLHSIILAFCLGFSFQRDFLPRVQPHLITARNVSQLFRSDFITEVSTQNTGHTGAADWSIQGTATILDFDRP